MAEDGLPFPRIAVIAQARMGSSRLPGKVLRHVEGRSLLEHLVRRVRLAKTPFELVIATTDHASDNPIEEAGANLGIKVFRGSEHDVLERYRGAAKWVDAEVIARITGDCPLLDGTELDRVLSVFLSRFGGHDAWDYVTNQAGAERKIPRGLDVEVFSRSALERAAKDASNEGEREHVTPYLYRTPGRFRTLVTDPEGMELGHLRLTVDTPADLKLIAEVLSILGPDAGVSAVADLLAKRPDLLAINADINQRGVDSEQQQRRRRIDGRLLLGRADRGVEMGSGHVARLASLLAAWVHLGGRARLVGEALEGFWAQRLESFGVEIEDGALPAKSFVERAHELGAIATALDGYMFGEQYVRTVSADRPTLAVDDLAAFPHSAQVVINQNIGFDIDRYGAPAGCNLLVGAKYILLRPEFWNQATPMQRRTQRIIMSFGSSDPAGMTTPMVDALLKSGSAELELVVVVGPGMDENNRERLEALGSDSRLQLLYDVEDMAALFRSAPIAVIAAGTTAWEALACGTVPVAVQVADNQAVVATGLVEHDAGIDLGWHEDCVPATCAQSILALHKDFERLERMATNGSGLVDGRGVWRALDALLDAVENWRTNP